MRPPAPGSCQASCLDASDRAAGALNRTKTDRLTPARKPSKDRIFTLFYERVHATLKSWRRPGHRLSSRPPEQVWPWSVTSSSSCQLDIVTPDLLDLGYWRILKNLLLFESYCYLFFLMLIFSRPDPTWTPCLWALARPEAGHSCQADQQDLSLHRSNSCLLRTLRIVISGEVLSSQLASLPPLMEGRQRQGKYNYWSEWGTPEPAAVPRFTAGTWHQSVRLVTGRFSYCKLRQTNKLGPFETCRRPLKGLERKSGAEAWCARRCDYPESLWNAPFLIKGTNIARCGPERDGG